MQISDKIAFLRKKKGWSQEQLAIKLDVSRQAVYKWEANITYPEIDKLKKLASLFEISFNDFFDDSVDITKKEESKAGEKQQNPVLENNGNVAEISVDKKAPGEKVQEATRTTPKSEADYTVKANQERNRIIALIVTLIVGIIACVTIGIVAFLSVTSGNEGTPQDPPSDNVGGENGGGEQQQPNDVYYSVTCRVLGEIYKVESVLKGEAYTPDNIQVGGYTFGGWLYKGELWTGGAVTKDMVLNAVLTPEENLVVFHANDGTGYTWEFYAETDTGILLTGKFDYKREGYKCKGYSLDENGDSFIEINDSYKVKAGTNHIYVLWEVDNASTVNIYKINYQLSGGTNSDFNPSTYSGTEPVLLREPTKEFYSFAGWYSDSLYKNKVTKIENITGDTTYFAKWDYVGYTIMLDMSTDRCELTRVDPSFKGFFEIPESAYGGFPVTKIGKDAFFGCTLIEEIYIPKTITAIESSAFNGTDSLNYIDVDNQNGYYRTYNGDLYIKPGTRLIKYASGKAEESFTLPKGCTYVNDYAFYGSKNLKSLDISETSGIGKFALAECAKLESVKVGEILNFIDAYAFKRCGLISFTVESDLYSVGNFAFSECPNLLTLTFNGSIGEVGWSAFKANPSLTSVTFNGTVDKLSTNLFEDCENLRVAALPEGIKLINKYMFQNCINLSSVSIPESVTLIEDGAFTYCTSLERISLHLGITEIQGSPFDFCDNLTIYCDASAKPNGWGADWNIYDCPVVWGAEGEAGLYDGLTFIENPDGTIYVGSSNDVESVVIPDAINGKKVVGILADTFKDNKILKTVTIYARNITVGLYAFSGCDALESVYVTDIDAWLSIDFQDATANPLSNGADLYVGSLRKCEKLTELVIPTHINIVKRYAFYGCTSVESVVFHSGIKKVEASAFEGCASVDTVKIQDADKWCGVEIENIGANPMIYSTYEYIGNEKITTLDLDVERVGSYCFAGCNELTDVKLSTEKTVRIGTGAFSGCTLLESIGIPKIVTYVGKGAFENCTSLSIYYESLNKPSGWDINWNISNCPVYYGCLDNKTEYFEFSKGQITKYIGSNSGVVVPSEIDGLKVASIVEGAFTNNKNIVSVVLPSSIVSIDERAFSGCDKLETVIISEGTKIIGAYAFEDCKSLKSVTIPSTAVMIYGYTFKGCTGLKEATLSEGLISVCNNMFEGCTQLETVNLPSSMQTLGQYAFADCSSLKNITLPDGLTTINRSVFLRCTSLTEIFIPISVTTIGNFVFNDTSDSLVIKCEAESQPDGWSYYLLSDKTVLWGQKR